MRPTSLPDWAYNIGATNITEPSTTQKQTGWATNQIPPASYFNWLDGNQSRWIRHWSYDPVISDDFAVNANFLNFAAGSSGTIAAFSYAGWLAEGNSVSYQAGTDGGTIASIKQISASGIARLQKTVGPIFGRDFSLEYLQRIVQTTTGIVQWGLFGGTSGVSPGLLFSMSGPSGGIVLTWTPSGKVPTSMTLTPGINVGGADTDGPSGYRTWSLEREDGIHYARANGLQIAAIATGAKLAVDSWSPVVVGIWVNQSQPTGNMSVSTDRLEMRIKRV